MTFELTRQEKEHWKWKGREGKGLVNGNDISGKSRRNTLKRKEVAVIQAYESQNPDKPLMVANVLSKITATGMRHRL
jgi:hypothetical protein